MMRKIDMKLIMIFVLMIFAGVKSFAQARETKDLQTALDTLASNEILRRAQDSLQWSVRIGEVTEDLGARLRTMSDSAGSLENRTADLAELVESLEGRVTAATEVNVNLASALRTDSARTETFAAAEVTDSITAPYNDGLLSGRIAFYPPAQLFGLEYTAQIRGSLVVADLPDGRVSVMAVAEDTARVSFSVGTVFVNRADPVQYFSGVTKGKWTVIGWALSKLR